MGGPAPVNAYSRPGRVLPAISPWSVGPCRGEGRPDLDGAHPATDRGVPRPSLWRRLRALDERINDCWIGDLLGIASLVVLATYAPIGLPMLIIIFGGNP